MFKLFGLSGYLWTESLNSLIDFLIRRIAELHREESQLIDL